MFGSFASKHRKGNEAGVVLTLRSCVSCIEATTSVAPAAVLPGIAPISPAVCPSALYPLVLIHASLGGSAGASAAAPTGKPTRG
nr:unnamed protein product [Digitaria exilis]